MLIIFLIGMAEMILNTLWAKYVAETKVFLTTSVTMIHVFIWYYVLHTVIEQINDIGIVLSYAFGCGVGTVIAFWAMEQYTRRSTARRTKKAARKAHAAKVAITAMPQLHNI
jgi:uncharacterized protein YebE (UPF0316 family)